MWQVVGCALVDVMAAVKLQDSKAAGKRLIKVGSPLSLSLRTQRVGGR